MGSPVKETKDEYEVSSRRPDTRTKWQAFKNAIYNPEEKTLLGRDKKKWGIVTVFYMVFYSVLAVLCAICYMGLMVTIDENRPKYTLDSSIIGTNPGMGFRPLPNLEHGSTISYTLSNYSHIAEWTARIDQFLEMYMDKTKLPNGGRNQMICNYSRPMEPGKVCEVDIRKLGNCSKAMDYGYRNSSPCVFIKLNRIMDWKPIFYNNPKDLPQSMKQDLKDYILRFGEAGKDRLNTIWVSCNGESPTDISNMGRLEYYPYQGFPGYYYPYENAPDYLSPVVAVRFTRPKINVTINVECKAWAKNIKYSSHRGEKVGSVHFELLIKE
ncbi:sodium/potassium-transporting ATPase subunit beta-2-like [Copidosoma floridanum]|uniref:sodium/potassium-transporting ATPase subunit beta-2-like n=1 Tax=Copidosoma floridanum TaxID=29053 RepID=UPI0006C9C157|nr:sodium/potassium-transporting ATPase subunit beta-2-like [Copidosoma floridanum]